MPPFQLDAATEYGVCLLGHKAKPPSWCAVMIISRIPIAAEAAIQSSASRSVGLKTSGFKHGCDTQADELGEARWKALGDTHVVSFGLWPMVD